MKINKRILNNISLFEENINYEFTNETPIFVGAQKDKNESVVDFFKNANNQYCIPGSSMKGVVRKNTEILGIKFFIKSG